MFGNINIQLEFNRQLFFKRNIARPHPPPPHLPEMKAGGSGGLSRKQVRQKKRARRFTTTVNRKSAEQMICHNMLWGGVSAGGAGQKHRFQKGQRGWGSLGVPVFLRGHILY